MRKIYDINVDLIRRDNIKKFTCKQNDDITLNIDILKDGHKINIDGQTLRVLIRKNDGTLLHQAEKITVNDNSIRVDLNNQATTCAGKTYMELEIIDALGEVSSSTIIYLVEEKVGDLEDAIESSNELFILKEIENFIKSSEQDIEEIKGAVNSAKNDVEESVVKINSVKEELEAINVNLDELKAENEKAVLNISELKLNNEQASLKKTELEEVLSRAIAEKDLLLEKITTGIETIQTLEGIITNAVNAKNVLLGTIAESKNSNNNLLSNITEAQSIYTELFTLVEEAKAITGVVRDFITANGGGAVIEEIKTDLEKVKTDVETNKTNIKEATDELSRLSTYINRDFYKKDVVNLLLNNKVNTASRGNISTTTANNDFNIILDTGHYVILENVLNGPDVELQKNDIFIVKNAVTKTRDDNDDLIQNGSIYQKIAGSVNYSRTCKIENNIETWSEWKEIGGASQDVDLSNYYTKEEIDEKVNIIRGKVGVSTHPAEYSTAPLMEEDEIYYARYMDDKGRYIARYMPATMTRSYVSSVTSVKLSAYLSNSNYKGGRKFYYDKNTGEWVLEQLSLGVLSVKIEDEKVKLYSHNFNIVSANSASASISYPAKPGEVGETSIMDFDDADESGIYGVDIEVGDDIKNVPALKRIKGILEVSTVSNIISQVLRGEDNEKYSRFYDGIKWTEWKKENIEDIPEEQIEVLEAGVNKDDIIDSEYDADFLNYLTPSLIEVNNGNLRVEYGEYIVDSAKNSPHVTDPLREYTDLIMLKKGGFKKVLGCMAYVDKLDFHYSIWCNPKVVLVNPANKADCLRLYIGYNAPDAIFKEEAFHPINGLKKVKYCVLGY